MMKKIAMTLLVLAFMAVSVMPARAEDPQQVVKNKIEEVIGILRDPKFKGGAQAKAQREEIWKAVEDGFDFDGVSRLTLGRNWKLFSTQEQTQFSQVFGRRISNTYLSKIQEGYRDEKVSIDSQESTGEGKVKVLTQIVRENGNIAVEYDLWLKDNHWKVYDVKVEGVSLVQNYRAQFNQMLLNDSPAQVIKKIQDKLDKDEIG